MKKIYIVTAIYKYEGAEVLGVYDTDTKALFQAKGLQSTEYGDYDAFVVEEVELGKFYHQAEGDDEPEVLEVFEVQPH